MKKELFERYYEYAEKKLLRMSLEEKVSQIIIAHYPGLDTALKQTSKFAPGGYIFFSHDFDNKSVSNIKEEIKKLQFNSNIKLFTAVDEEGGSVCRVSSHPNLRYERFKSPKELLKEGSLEALLQDAIEKSILLKSLGINTNLAPVVDLPTSEKSFMYDRAFGKNPKETGEYAAAIIQEMLIMNLLSCVKHFPGYGDNTDTHTGIAIDNRDMKDFFTKDFIPFEKCIRVGVPMIMVNHNIVKSLDENYPASLSLVIHSILRAKLEFSGLIITDDLNMDAVKEYADNGCAAVSAILAGNDMIITSDFDKHKKEILDAIPNTISMNLIDTIVRRIIACKSSFEFYN